LGNIKKSETPAVYLL